MESVGEKIFYYVGLIFFLLIIIEDVFYCVKIIKLISFYLIFYHWIKKIFNFAYVIKVWSPWKEFLIVQKNYVKKYILFYLLLKLNWKMKSLRIGEEWLYSKSNGRWGEIFSFGISRNQCYNNLHLLSSWQQESFPRH